MTKRTEAYYRHTSPPKSIPGLKKIYGGVYAVSLPGNGSRQAAFGAPLRVVAEARHDGDVEQLAETHEVIGVTGVERQTP